MAGDFGEMLAFIFQLADKGELDLCGPKKWRLKIDRRKASPMSDVCLLYTSPSPRDLSTSRMPSSA